MHFYRNVLEPRQLGELRTVMGRGVRMIGHKADHACKCIRPHLPNVQVGHFGVAVGLYQGRHGLALVCIGSGVHQSARRLGE